MKKTVLSALIAVAVIAPAHATEDGNYAFLDALAEQPLFKDAKLTLTAKNFWKYLKEDESQPKEVHNAWGQSFGFNYQSGYFADFIGFDFSFVGAVKLGASDYFATRGVLYNDNGTAKGYSKFDQRYLKFKLGDEQLGFHGKAGWQILKNYGTLTASTRLSQNSYLGYSGTFRYENLALDLAYVTSSINRDAPDKVPFKTNDGKVIDHITTGGLTYKDKTTYFTYNYGESDNYLRRHVIEMSYKPVSELTLGSQIYGSYAQDDYKSMALSKKEFNDHAWHYAFDAKWQTKNWSTKLGVAYTKAEKDNGIGYYGRHLAKNSRGRFNSMTSAGVDYMRDGELALTALTTYNFVPELTSGIQVNYGQFDYKDNTVRSGEINLINIWKPTDKRLKNFSVGTMFGYGWSYKHQNKTPTLDHNGHYQRSPSLSAEVVIDYRFDLF